jgi:hypothetical protein
MSECPLNLYSTVRVCACTDGAAKAPSKVVNGSAKIAARKAILDIEAEGRWDMNPSLVSKT